MTLLDIAAIVVLVIILGVAAWYWVPVLIAWDLDRKLNREELEDDARTLDRWGD